jgi:hypothetical protein
MRTTLDIEDDVLIAAKELARREGKTAGQMLSELARRALSGAVAKSDATGIAGEIEQRFGFRAFGSRGGLVTNERIERLKEEDGD